MTAELSRSAPKMSSQKTHAVAKTELDLTTQQAIIALKQIQEIEKLMATFGTLLSSAHVSDDVPRDELEKKRTTFEL